MVRRILQSRNGVLVAIVVLALASNVSAAHSSVTRASNPSVYNFTHRDSQSENQSMTPAASLGSFSAKGGSPGYIIGRSWKDDQAHINPGRTLGWGGGSPVIHFAFTNQPDCPGADNIDVCARYLEYSYFDPSNALSVPKGTTAQSANIESFVTEGMYASVDVDETGHMVLTGEWFNSSEGVNALKRVGIFWDVSAPGDYENFIEDSLPGEYPAMERYKQPEIEYQEYNGSYITHVISVGGYGPMDLADGTYSRQLTYWRKVNSASGPSGTWTSMVFEDTSWSDQYSMGCEHDGDGNVGIAWVRWRDPTGGAAWGSHIYVILSDDAGATWSEKVDLVPFDYDTDSWQPWIECDALMDHDGYFHVVWNANRYSGTSYAAISIDPTRLFHWTNRVPGPAAGGTTSLIHIADFDGLIDMCGRGSSNVLNLGHAVVSECNDRLYTTWVQYGDPENGDTSDCADPSLAHSLGLAYNGDIFMSVSSTLDGSLWDAARNLTNSKSPGCDTTSGNECDDDNYSSVSRYGMNNAEFGTLYWDAVPEAFQVASELDPTYPADGYYLDVQYVDDLVPAPARYGGEGAIWSYDPIKWFRLPCVPPVLEPRILIGQENLTYPLFWLKPGQEKVVDVPVENIGNDVLNVTSITAHLLGTTPSGAVQITPPSLTVEAGSSDYVQVTINPGGAISPPTGTAVAIEAEVVFTSDDPGKPTTSFLINTIVADTVVQVAWDTVYAGASWDWGLGLKVANNGNAGNRGEGMVNMDFIQTGLECDSSFDVYLYDLTPVLMTGVDHYSWSPYWTEETARSFNFTPVGDGLHAKHVVSSDYDGYSTDQFVNSDSTIAMVKTWFAPRQDASFIVERFDIWSNDGATHPGVRIGELIDWDVPSDAGADNRGGFVTEPDWIDYLWQQGLEYDPGVGCHDNDRRFAASTLLGYYRRAEYATNRDVNHTGLHGGFVLLKSELFGPSSDTLDPDSMWAWLNRNELSANNDEAGDQVCLLSFGSFDVSPDPLIVWVAHSTLYDGDEAALYATMADLSSFYWLLRTWFGPYCCGVYAGGFTGNTDCSTDGKMNLADVTKLIDRIYLSKTALCCEPNGDVDGDDEHKMNLADITRLVDHIYLSKQPTAWCR